jgi:hypothetical protein
LSIITGGVTAKRKKSQPGAATRPFVGSGTGKTHLAVAFAYRAIQNGFEARFTSATALIFERGRHLELRGPSYRTRHVQT